MQEYAIVGMSCRYPGLGGVSDLWKTIISRKYSLSKMSGIWADRFLNQNYNFSNNNEPSHSLYTTEYGSISENIFIDAIRFGLPPSLIEGDPSQFACLQVAAESFSDYIENGTQCNINSEKIGVVIGKGDHPQRGLWAALLHGIGIEQMVDMLINALKLRNDRKTREIIRVYLAKKIIPEYNRGLVPNLISNVISGTVANRLGLNGPNFMVDAACSSAVIAIDYAMKTLANGECEHMIVGGVQTSMNIPIYELFTALEALSTEHIRPLDQGSKGTLLSEGVGFIVLRKLEAAIKDHEKIYGIISGLGIASDGKGKGLLAPNQIGQVLAINKAYASSDLSKKDISLIEVHATGIKHGDKTELSSLCEAFDGIERPLSSIGLTSIKSLIGHSIPASGFASIIKLCLCLKSKKLIGGICENPYPELLSNRSPFYIVNKNQYWETSINKVRAAGFNSFGFGGINGHVVLREADEKKVEVIPKNNSVVKNKSESSLDLLKKKLGGMLVDVNNSDQGISLYTFEADSWKSCSVLIERAILENNGDLPGYRAYVTGKHISIRGYFTARGGSEMSSKLKYALESIESIVKDSRNQLRGSGWMIYNTKRDLNDAKVVWLIAGEGNLNHQNMSELINNIPTLSDWLEIVNNVRGKDFSILSLLRAYSDESSSKDDKELLRIRAMLNRADIATQIIAITVFGFSEIIKDLGIDPDILIGHSAGETDAVILSGLVGVPSREKIEEIIHKLNNFYLENNLLAGMPLGECYTVAGITSEDLIKLCKPDNGFEIISFNSPTQAVVFASKNKSKLLEEKVSKYGGFILPTGLKRPYHTKYFKKGAEIYEEFYKKILGEGERLEKIVTVISCLDGKSYEGKPIEVYDRLIKQWQKPVDFRKAIDSAFSAGGRIFIEIGPSSMLSSYAKETLKGKDGYHVFALGTSAKDPIRYFIETMAKLWSIGLEVDLEKLMSNIFNTNVMLKNPNLKRSGLVRVKSDLPFIDTHDLHEFLKGKGLIKTNRNHELTINQSSKANSEKLSDDDTRSLDNINSKLHEKTNEASRVMDEYNKTIIEILNASEEAAINIINE